MSRFPRLRRRPDHFTSPHERAQVAAAERLDGPLGLAESAWLDEHLASCPACSTVAGSYEADRLALRGLRSDPPQPPRDLWARTAAAIEQEAAHRARPAAARRSSPRRVPLGALSGVAVIAVVLGASVLSNSIVPSGADPVAEDAATGLMRDLGSGQAGGGGAGGAEATGSVTGVRPTPFAVGAGEVQWVREQGDGTLAYNVADVDEVCPAEAKEGCATLSEDAGSRISIAAEPESIIASPDDTTAVVVSRDASGSQELLVLDLEDQAQASSTPASTVAPETPAATPDSASPSPAAASSPSPAPTTSADPVGQSPALEPTAEPEPSGMDTSASEAPPSASPSETPSAPPSETAASETPSTTPEAATQPPVVASPEPTVAARLAIASDIEVIGESAAFSSDGSWFAFTATKGDGGPNVYLWKVGEEQAQLLTEDGRSVFASWENGSLIVSRPVVDGGDQPTAATNLLIDPDSGEQRDGPDTWRPVLDPGRTRAVAWDGTILADEDGMWHPAEGRLVVSAWVADGGVAGDIHVLAEAPIGDFDVRWDETGGWFAVWIADPADPGIGQLDLYRVDPATGAIDQPEGAPDSVRALPGFSIGQGRLAWATPPGQEGEGSRVQIVAWNDEGVGTVETAPGEDVVVIR